MGAEEETGMAAVATGMVVAETGAVAVIGAAGTRHGIIHPTRIRIIHTILVTIAVTDTILPVPLRTIMAVMEDLRQLSIS